MQTVQAADAGVSDKEFALMKKQLEEMASKHEKEKKLLHEEIRDLNTQLEELGGEEMADRVPAMPK